MSSRIVSGGKDQAKKIAKQVKNWVKLEAWRKSIQARHCYSEDGFITKAHLNVGQNVWPISTCVEKANWGKNIDGQCPSWAKYLQYRMK